MTRILLPEVFEEMFKDFITRTGGVTQRVINEDTVFTPRADIWETDKGYYIQLMIPGVEKDSIDIEFVDNILTVRGERKIPSEEGIKFHLVETPYGKFERAFRIPENVDESKIEAKYENGILSIFIPKKEKEVKKISIKVGGTTKSKSSKSSNK